MNTLMIRTPLLAVFALGCFAFPAQMQAATDTPDPGSVAPTNTADGDSALAGTTGFYNSAFGFLACLSNGFASFNTGIGAGALLLNTSTENTAVGTGTLSSNTTAQQNTACGAFALFTNSTGGFNSAVGANSLLSNVDGSFNTALGEFALADNTSGSRNTAVGSGTLTHTTTGNRHTAVGDSALQNCIAAQADFFGNTAVGASALFSDTTGNFNTAVGGGALAANTTGSGNIAIGLDAGNNVATADNVICIGNLGADVSNTTWVGNVFGVTTVSGTTAPVIVSDGGQLGTAASSERFKKDIATMQNASEAILALRPVTFHYKADTEGAPQFGLIAEEVAKVNPALVLPDKEGKPYTVRYDAVNVMLLNEFLKEHRKVEQLTKDFESTVAQQQKQIEALTAHLQKVSAQIELSKRAPQTVLNR